MSLLRVQDLSTEFFTEEGVVKAVAGVSFDVEAGTVLGIVGESGSGKSVTALSILRLILPPGKTVAGSIALDGVDLLAVKERELRTIRGNRISMIFQDPLTSLNPVLRIGYQLEEAVLAHHDVKRQEARRRAVELLGEVGIHSPQAALNRYPHEFSGGMRQRVMIAMALINNPEILIADEPTTALDVTIQAQILNLMKNLKDEYRSSIILITHDLGVIAEMADDVIVMYAGRVFEKGRVDDIFYRSRNPYTWSLLQSIPRLDVQKGKLVPIEGLPPSLIDLPSGCPFHPRCRFAKEACIYKAPQLVRIADGHDSYCHFAAELSFEETNA